MKKIIKKLPILAIMVVLSAFIYNMNVRAVDGKMYGDFRYEYDYKTGYVRITGYRGNRKVVEIPATINGVQVKYISDLGWLDDSGEDYETKDKVKKVILPQGIEVIGGFGYFSNLVEINIPESVTEIGSDAFEGCEKLKEIKLPGNLKKIGTYAFSFCEGLVSIEIPDTVKVIGEGAFDMCKKLKHVKLPKGLKKIERSTFSFCESLEEIAIPDSVTMIDSDAFRACRKLRKIKLPKKLTSIDDGAFECCEELIKIEIPPNVTQIGKQAFMRCLGLEKVIIKGKKIKKIGNDAFKGIRFKTVFDVPNKSINKYKKLLTAKTGFMKGTMKIK